MAKSTVTVTITTSGKAARIEDPRAKAIRQRFCPSCGPPRIGHQLLGSLDPDVDPNSANCIDCGCTWGGLRRCKAKGIAVAPPESRRPTAIAGSQDSFLVLLENGELWILSGAEWGGEWEPVPELPKAKEIDA